MSDDRGTKWSITHHVESEEEAREYMSRLLPPGWKLTGQLEAGKESGKLHVQALLSTPQVRFSAVKKILPTSHIEKARSPAALAKYVNKEDTRVAALKGSETIPNMFEYSEDVARRLSVNHIEREMSQRLQKGNITPTEFAKLRGEMLMDAVEMLVNEDIKNGKRGIEFHSVNPMFVAAWKKHGWAMVERARREAEQAEQNKIFGEGIEDVEEREGSEGTEGSEGCEGPEGTESSV